MSCHSLLESSLIGNFDFKIYDHGCYYSPTTTAMCIMTTENFKTGFPFVPSLILLVCVIHAHGESFIFENIDDNKEENQWSYNPKSIDEKRFQSRPRKRSRYRNQPYRTKEIIKYMHLKRQLQNKFRVVEDKDSNVFMKTSVDILNTRSYAMDGTFSTVVRINRKWYDPRLTWNPVQYANITRVIFGQPNFVAPRFDFLQSVTQRPYFRTMMITSDGFISYTSRNYLKHSCNVEEVIHPTLPMKCGFTFYVLNLPINQADLMLVSKEVKFLGDDCYPWKIQTAVAEKRIIEDLFIERVAIRIEFTAQHAYGGVKIHILMNAIITGVLALGNLFMIPISGEKIGFGFSLLVSYSLMPRNMNKLGLGMLTYNILYIYLMGFTCGAIACGIASLWISYNTANTRKRVPQWLLHACKRISKYTGIPPNVKIQLQEMEDYFKGVDEDYSRTMTSRNTMTTFTKYLESEDNETFLDGVVDDLDIPDNPFEGINESNVRQSIRKTVNAFNRVGTLLNIETSSSEMEADTDFENEILNIHIDTDESVILLFSMVQQNIIEQRDIFRMRQWLFVAMVVDRIFFVILFTYFFVLMLIGFILPYIYAQMAFTHKSLC